MSNKVCVGSRSGSRRQSGNVLALHQMPGLNILGAIERIERAGVMYMIVAWRIARLMRLGRSCPDLDAVLMFEADEWKSAYILNKEKLPNNPPSLNEVVRLVAPPGSLFWRARATGCRVSKPSGWASSASPTSPLASSSLGSFWLMGVFYNEMGSVPDRFAS